MERRAFQARLEETAAAVERELEHLLALEAQPGEAARPRRLIEAMRYATLKGGKRLRPFLVVETARALGRSDGGPRRVGAAIECVHAYSLIHDDLPAMDDDDLRRGRPTAHRAFDEATAILAGDALQALAFEILGRSPDRPERRDPRGPLVGAGARRGPRGHGRRSDARYRGGNRGRAVSLEEIARLQAMKTGALLRFSVEAGALLAGAGPKVSDALGAYGSAVGAAFQIADDLLDAEGDTATLGKRAGKDAGRRKATLVAALGLEGARRELKRLVDKARAAVDAAGLGASGDGLRAAAEFVAARKS